MLKHRLLAAITSTALLFTVAGCSALGKSLISEETIIDDITENIPNATHIETIHDLHPNYFDEEYGCNIYTFNNGEFDFKVYNYMTYISGKNSATNKLDIEYDFAVLHHLQPQIKEIIESHDFTYQYANHSDYDEKDRHAVLLVHDTLGFDTPYLKFYVDDLILTRNVVVDVKACVIEIATLIEPYLMKDNNMQDVNTLPIVIKSLSAETFSEETLYNGHLSFEKKVFEKDLATWNNISFEN